MSRLIKIVFLLLIAYSLTLNAQGFKTLGLLMGDAAEDVYAIDINGTDEYCSIASPTSILPNSNYSIIMWFKAGDLDGQQALLSRDSDASAGWMLYLESNVTTYLNDISIGDAIAETSTRTIGEWTLVVITQKLSPNVLDIYINGTAVHNTKVATSNTSTTAQFNIGRRSYPGYLSFFNGLVGQVQFIEGYALGEAEINSLYNAGGMLNASYGGGTVVAWYKWSGSTDEEMLQDYSASNNDLTGNNVTTADQVLIGASYK